MGETERIKKDITLFEESVTELDSLSRASNEEEVIELAKGYYEDTKYYLEKGDYFTAFGCINYAHGLLDGIKRKKERTKKQKINLCLK
ncbi:MAG: DUF357 domain-containing protein [Methanophagales archaeon]|nr:DUF357 domain-containing protein [Methanophagales archaeon]